MQILIGGMANPKDPYGLYCINLMITIKSKYPLLFWADPYQFFTDGPLVNLGADFVNIIILSIYLYFTIYNL